MAYTKNTTWVDGESGGTRIDASDLNNIEDGIYNAAATADAAIPETLIDAKGDLIVGTAADMAGRLAVGTDGHVLTADAASAGGVKWAAAGGGGSASIADTWGMFARPPLVGRYFTPTGQVPGGQPGASNPAKSYFYPVILTRPVTLNQVATYCWTLDASGAMRVALYTASAIMEPVSLIADLGVLSGTTTGAKTITIAQDVPAVFMVALYVSSSGTVKFDRALESLPSLMGPQSIGDAALGVQTDGGNYSAGFPATAPTVTHERWSINSPAPGLHLRAGALL